MKKASLIFIACGILWAAPCRGLMLQVVIEKNGETPEFYLNTQKLPLNTILKMLKEITADMKDVAVIVRPIDDKVSAKILIETISALQEIGLRNLVLVTAGEKNGKKGTYLITVDATKKQVGGCVRGSQFDSGFMPDDFFAEKIAKRIERVEQATPVSTPVGSTQRQPAPISPVKK